MGQDKTIKASSTKLLMAKDERTDPRLCQKLPGMSTKQVLMTSAVRAILAPRTTLCPVAVYRHGLHHGVTTVGRMRPTLGNHR